MKPNNNAVLLGFRAEAMAILTSCAHGTILRYISSIGLHYIRMAFCAGHFLVLTLQGECRVLLVIEAFCFPIEGMTVTTFASHLTLLQKLPAMRVAVAGGTGLRCVSIATCASQSFMGLMALRAGNGTMCTGQWVDGIVLLQAIKNGREPCFAVAFGARRIAILKLPLMRILMAVFTLPGNTHELLTLRITPFCMTGRTGQVCMGFLQLKIICVTCHGHSAGVKTLLRMAVEATGILLSKLPLMRVLMTAAAVFGPSLIIQFAGIGIPIRIGKVGAVTCRAGHIGMGVGQDEACETVHERVHAALAQRPGAILRPMAVYTVLAEIRSVGGRMAVHASRTTHRFEWQADLGHTARYLVGFLPEMTSRTLGLRMDSRQNEIIIVAKMGCWLEGTLVVTRFTVGCASRCVNVFMAGDTFLRQPQKGVLTNRLRIFLQGERLRERGVMTVVARQFAMPVGQAEVSIFMFKGIGIVTLPGYRTLQSIVSTEMLGMATLAVTVALACDQAVIALATILLKCNLMVTGPAAIGDSRRGVAFSTVPPATAGEDFRMRRGQGAGVCCHEGEANRQSSQCQDSCCGK